MPTPPATPSASGNPWPSTATPQATLQAQSRLRTELVQARQGWTNRLATAAAVGRPVLRQVIRSLQTQIAKLDRQLAAALRADPELQRQAQRLLAKGKPGKVRVGAAMRKLLCLCVGVLRSNQPWNPTGRPTPKTSDRKSSP